MPDESHVPEKCQTCRFWDDSELDNPQEGRVDLGQCHRGHPVTVLGQVPISIQADEYPEEARDDAHDAVWPVTREWDWCGEWELRGDWIENHDTATTQETPEAEDHA